MEAPFTAREGAGLQGRGDPELAPGEARVTTRVDVAVFAHKWVEGRRVHRCQIAPALAETLSVPPDAIPDIYGVDEYILARDLTQHGKGAVVDEVDLFAHVGSRGAGRPDDRLGQGVVPGQGFERRVRDRDAT